MRIWKLTAVMLLTCPLFGQECSPHDFGRMWTFENPPKEWFQKAYEFTADDAWFDYVRKSSLRFASWCSASFVSPDGLLMTNFHCSSGEVYAMEQEGEDLARNGFYANTRADERRSPGLYVEQLLKVEDVTDKVNGMVQATDEQEIIAQRQAAFQAIQAEYGDKSDWEGLRLQIVPFYSGTKFSVYGYRRYDDVRLVCIPEQDLGQFGGDPDNFTYPRYTLDFTFWRVYDENGSPVNSSNNYFKFNTQDITEGQPVFIIGNPGSTERYRTVSQLEYDRDYRYPIQLTFMQNRYNLMADEYAVNPSHELEDEILTYSNSIKAFSGIVDGLNDSRLFSRKLAMEKYIRSRSGESYWDSLTVAYDVMGPQLAELQFLSPNPQVTGSTVTLMHLIYMYSELAGGDFEEATLEELRSEIRAIAEGLNTDEEIKLFGVVLGELKQFADPGDTYIDQVLQGRSPGVAAREILSETDFVKEKKLEKLLKKNPEKFRTDKDVLISMSNEMMPLYYKAVAYFQSTGAKRHAYEEKIAKEVFKVYGEDLPPDATFTLRISDGIVASYEYNGTIAPVFTTYYGLYNRYYSHGQVAPWNIPERWQSPSPELLKTPLNIVATTDIIGGNSGSAMINTNHEVIGLAFDGNMESLPGNFIFDDEKNRTIGVHAAGIIAALRVYKADKLIDELLGK